MKKKGVLDLLHGFTNYSIWLNLALAEIKCRFRRTIIGPFWITLSLIIWVGMLGYVNSALFGANIFKTLPQLTVGMIFWTFFATTINESCNAFTASENVIKTVPMKLSVHVYNIIMQNSLILLFNLILYPLIIIISYNNLAKINLNYFLFIPGFLLFFINIAWASIFLSVISTRFRDVPKIVSTLTQVLFFITPVFWTPSQSLKPKFVEFNPFHHLIDIVRSPLLGMNVSINSWVILFFIAILGTVITLITYEYSYKKITKWI